MTTARQIKTIFRPLSERNADFAYPGKRDLWLTPIRHLAFRVFVNQTWEADAFRLGWTILPTFIATPDFLGIIGKCSGYINPPERIGSVYWPWSEPSTVESAISTIESETLPHLRSFEGLEHWAAYYRATFPIALTGFPHDRLILDIALGNLPAARALLAELLPHFRENKSPDQPIYQYMRSLILPVAEPLMADDRPGLAKILHGWEAENIRSAKLEPHWEPTPFPLERAPA